MATDAMSSRRCSFPAATSAASRSMARSTTSPWPARGRSTWRPASFSRKAFRSAISSGSSPVDGAQPRARPACRSLPATPRWSRRARATASSSPPPASASCRRASRSRATGRAPAMRILVSGTIGDHGMAIMSQRENLEFETDDLSDTAALHGLVAEMVAAVPGIHCLRDPDTRRACHHAQRDRAAVARAASSSRGARSRCKAAGARGLRIPRPRPALCRQRRQAGRDLRRRDAARLLAAMRAHPLGRDAALIGEVVADAAPLRADADTRFGGRRIVDWLLRRAAAADLLRRAGFLELSGGAATKW